MVEHVFHGSAVWKSTLKEGREVQSRASDGSSIMLSHLYNLTTVLSNFPVSALTFVSMQKKDQLLLNQLSLLRICGGRCGVVANSARRT